MKKIFLIFTIQLFLLSWCYAGKPINITPVIEGKAVDATTGKPIENVVISCQWVEKLYGFVDTVSKTFHTDTIVTDPEGKYRIHKKKSLHLWLLIPGIIGSEFSYLRISFIHPLYETKEVSYADIEGAEYRDYGDGAPGIYETEVIKKAWGESLKYKITGKDKDGKIHYDVKLLSLEEKCREIIDLTKEEREFLNKYRELKGKSVCRFVSNLKKEEIAKIEEDFKKFQNEHKKIELIGEKKFDFMTGCAGGIENTIEYYKNLKKDYNLRYDLNYIFEKTKNLGIRMYGHKNQWFNREIKDIEKAFKKLKEEGY